MDLTPFVELFEDDGTPLVRADFSDDAAWQTVVAAATRSVDFDDPANADPGDAGYAPHVVAVDDPAYLGVDGAALGEAFTANDEASGYVLIADTRSMSEARAGGEVTVDYVDLSVSDPEDAELFDSFPGRTFRCAVAEIASIEANLSISNMDFSEFADSTGPDGVFRGFDDQ